MHLKDILLVDNAVYSFGDQIDNGIPITPFKEDPRDTEFLNLIKYLEKCADAYDVFSSVILQSCVCVSVLFSLLVVLCVFMLSCLISSVTKQ